MSRTYVKYLGTWTEALEIHIKDQGSWKLLNGLFVRTNNVWKKVYPNSPGESIYTTPGTYTFVVPSGVTSITTSLYGAGGGAGSGGWSFCGLRSGDAFNGGGGGSGGFRLSQILSVTPGETLTIIVGAKGVGGTYPGSGTVGGTTSITGSLFGTITATGGGGGNAGPNCSNGAGGAAGFPNGVAGQQGFINCGGGAGGDNRTPYGRGGSGLCGLATGNNGTDGALILNW